MNSFFRKTFYRLQQLYIYKVNGFCRITLYNLLGASIPYSVRMRNCTITWPHQVEMGHKVKVEENVEIKIDGKYKDGRSVFIGDSVYIGRGAEFNIIDRITIENQVMIASGAKFVDHDHGIDRLKIIGKHPGKSAPIILQENCWIGANVIVLKGVTVGQGAVVAAGSVVIHSIPAFEIWAGIPAKKIGERK